MSDNTENAMTAKNGQPDDAMLWSVKETLKGRKLLVTGSTGFLGKIFVSMLLNDQPDVDHVYLLIRPRRFEPIEVRLQREVIDTPVFDPLREKYGDDFDAFIEKKITVLAGDITSENLGMDAETAKGVSSAVDVIVASAGLTNFNPNLENALTINTLSSDVMLDFIRLGGSRAKLLHVSTAFVAGTTDDPTQEVAPSSTIYPFYKELQTELDHRREINDCLALIKHVELLAGDQERSSLFAKQTRDALHKINVDPDDTEAYELEFKDARKRWVKSELSRQGRVRASHWGWVNIYTYTKSLGERILVEDAGDIDVSIFRPAIIESAISYPKVGWNEGSNTTAPICYLIYKGHRFVPTHSGINIDIIPVDMTTGAMMAMCAALLRGEHDDVYHLGSSDRNPISVPRCIELASLSTRTIIEQETSTPALQKFVRKTLDGIAVDQKTYNRQSMPQVERLSRGLQGLIKKVPTLQLGGIGKALEVIDRQAKKAETMAITINKVMEIFEPFIWDNQYIFRARNIEALRGRIVEEERTAYGSIIEDLEWRQYWTECHMPGLKKFVFEDLESKLRQSSRDTRRFKDLNDVFDASTKNYPDRPAFQFHKDGNLIEKITYREVDIWTKRAAKRLRDLGLPDGGTILIMSENRPEWPSAYIAAIRSGGIAVPLDGDGTAAYVHNLSAKAKACFVIASDSVRENLQLDDALSDQQAVVLSFADLFAEDEPTVSVPDGFETPDDVPEDTASLIFTSGTTGDPKGVMLSQKNFVALLSSLDGMFKIGERDGFLSVLPLHHTFEFTCGFLMPFSKGAAITYIDELNGDELKAAMTNTRITAMIGVPALWQLLHRRVQQNVDATSPATKWVFGQLKTMNTSLRTKTGMNFGPTFFGEVHRTFGSRMKYLISGGASLPEDVLEAFYGMGFNMYEGYGLTEAAPVLTVNRPDDGLRSGSVGKALPGIEIKIHEPNKEGVGEVIARGESVMLGYLGREDDTKKTLRDGWLFTGDLGTLDKKGRLKIVGRSKEIIVTASGKNVYPDELEEIYGGHKEIAEISVVGIDDGNGSERVACLIRCELEDDANAEKVTEVRKSVREWIRVEGARVPAHQRISNVRFWDEELPRTATRKIKRSEVTKIIGRLMHADASASETTTTSNAWLAELVGSVAGVNADKIHAATRFQDDLGFDSLMAVELASLLSAREVHVTSELLADVQTYAALESLVASPSSRTALVKSKDDVDEIPIPRILAKAGREMLYRAQMSSYQNLFDVSVYGQAHIPYHDPNTIVVANHASHLDMGLVKYALGDFGSNIRALAAADYFFSSTAKKTYFKNFTNLIPLNRGSDPSQALAPAVDALRGGETLLMFPEGTRGTDGKLRTFRKGLGFLAATQKVNILPVFLEGTHRALPKGQSLPSLTSRKLKVRIGRPIDVRQLINAAKAANKTESETYEMIADAAYQSVLELSQVGRSRRNSGPMLQPLFEELNGKFARDQVDDEVSFYFSLGQVDDQKWTVVVDADACQIRQGKPDGSADCVIKTTPEVFRKIVQERYVPSMDEFMDGTIKTNSPDLLVRFQTVFRLQES